VFLFIKFYKAVARNLVVLTPVNSTNKQSVLKARDSFFNGVNVTQINETVSFLIFVLIFNFSTHII